MHTGRLVLALQDPFLATDAGHLERALRTEQLIAEPLAGSPGAFAAGPRFLELITFAGCSVRVALSPRNDGTAFSHLQILGPYATPRFLHGRNTRPPRCRACRGLLKDWRTLMEAGAGTLACPACGTRASASEWDWKENAGFGRVFVLVEEVFPGEAVPAPALLDLLAGATGHPWRHFYLQDPRS